MTACWLRVRGGALIAEVGSWSVEQVPSWERNGPGECAVRIPLSDPSIAHLRLPDDAGWRTWYESNIELALWRVAPEDAAPFVTPAVAPTWAGPIVGWEREPGWLIVRAFSQEAYIQRSCIGDTLINYLITDGAGEGYTFDGDPDLSEWTVDTIGFGSATYDDDPPQYLPGGVAVLSNATMFAAGEVPYSPNGNYAHVGVAVMVPSGSTPLFEEEDGSAVVGEVLRLTSTDGMGSWGILRGGESHRLILPPGWEHDRWYGLSVQMRQPRNIFVRYRLSLYGGSASGIRFSAPKINRPANVGAAAGSDIGQVAAAICEEQVDLLNFGTFGPWSRDNDAVGIDLHEPARYFADAHEDASDALNDWTPYLDWWVEDPCTLRTGQRGSEISETLTNEDLSGWRVEGDASDAYSHLYVQVRPEDGPHDQVVLTVDEPATRLTHVVEVPAGMAPADAVRWGEAVLEDGAPSLALTGVPVKFETLPGERLADFMPGNYLTVTLTEDGPSGPITDTFEPTVQKVTWDPVEDVVRPTWVLGRKARRDETEMLAAFLKAQERERRRKRPPPSPPDYGHLISGTSTNLSSDGPFSTFTMEIPAGTWAVWAVQTQSGASGGTHWAQVTAPYGGSISDRSRMGRGAEVSSSTTPGAMSGVVEVRGPCTVLATGRSDLTGPVADRRLTIYAERTG